MESLNVISQFNWVDIFVLILLLRISYIAIKSGLPIELFKSVGLILATYLAMHYYSSLSGLIKEHLSIKIISLELVSFFTFVVLACCGYLVFILLRQIFARFIQIEAATNLNKWGGFALGLFRVVLLLSLFMFVLVISPVKYLKSSVAHAYSGKYLFKVAPATYTALWNKLISKFVVSETFNKSVLEVEENLDK